MKNSKGLSALFLFIGFLFLLTLLGLNPFVIKKISAGALNDYYLSNIHKVQLLIAATGIGFIIVGLLGYKQNIFRFANKSKKLTNVLTMAILLLGGTLFIEYILRIKPEFTTQELYDLSVRYDGSIFSQSIFPTESFNVPYRYRDDKINYRFNQGYHGDPFSYTKPADEVRIVVLGGSFIFGDHQATTWIEIENEYNRNWIQQIEQKLHDDGLTQIRVINAGIPGHTSYDSFGRFFSEIHMIDPDYVFFCHGWNDIKFFSNIRPDNSILRQIKPVKETDRNQVSDPFEISQIYLRIKRLFQFRNKGLEGSIANQQGDAKISPFAVKQFDLNLDLLIQACRSTGAQPVLLTQPRLIHENNNEEQRKRIRYDFQALNHEGIVEAYDMIDSMVMNYPQKDSMVISHDFAKPYIGIDSLFNDHVHLISAGSDVLSSHLADFIKKLVIEPK